jgi:hypothetical protein
MLDRIPALAQLIVIDVFILVCLGVGGLARIADWLGWHGARHFPAPDGLVWGSFAFGLFLLVMLLKQVILVRIQKVSWSPVRHFGGFSVVFGNDYSRSEVNIFSSHPAYVLADLVAGFLPLMLVLASWNDDPAHNPVALLWRWALGVWAFIPLARLLGWYVFRRGPGLVKKIQGDMPKYLAQRLEWVVAWQPVLMMWAIIIVVVGIPLTMTFIRGE